MPISISISTLEELTIYINQNQSDEVRRRRGIREALRALNVFSNELNSFRTGDSGVDPN